MYKVSTFLFSLLMLMMLWVPSQAQQAYRNDGKDIQLFKESRLNVQQHSNRSPEATFFEEGFESGDFTTNGWTLTDADGDGNQWGFGNLTAHNGAGAVGSNSWFNGVVLTPDNWLASKAIDLTEASGTVLLDFWVRAQDQIWPKEHYAVYASTSGVTPADFTGENGTNLFEETLKAGTDADNNLYVKRTVDLSAFAGAPVYIAFRHYDCSDWFILNLDDIVVYESSTIDVGITGATAPSNIDNCTLTDDEPVTVTLFNYGGAPQTGFDVSYTFNGTMVTETFVATIEPASSADFTFAQTASFTDLGYYTIDFALVVEGDIDNSNDNLTYKISNTDAEVVIEVSTDSNGAQAWELLSSNGDVIASHGSYQWNITETTKVCVIADDCYIFNWGSAAGTSNTVSVYYNGDLVNTRVADGSYTLFSVGGACIPVNAAFYETTIEDYGVVGDQTFGGSFLNIGSENLTSFDVQYSVDGVASTVETISGIDVGQGDAYSFTHPIAYNFTNIGAYSVEVMVSNFNGTSTPANNTLGNVINILSYKPTTRVLGEEATGTWCGWCTRGHVFLEFMEQQYHDTWVGVAVHNGDPMVVTAYDAAIGNYIGGYPSGLVNRKSFDGSHDVDPLEFEQRYLEVIDKVVPLDITFSKASYDANSLKFTVNANFAGDINKKFNMSAIIVENNVTGSGAGWDQANYYSGGGNGPMGGYENLPDPVLAADMVYQNVGRALIGGWSGMENIIPEQTTAGSTYAYDFAVNLSAGISIEDFVIIGLVTDRVTGEVVNVNKVSVNTAVKVDKIVDLIDFNIYPNPVGDVVNIELGFENSKVVEIFVTDNMGRKITTLEESISTDFYSTKLDMSSYNKGIYFLNVRSAQGISVKKMIKQ